jgi:serine-type D-Ala-D-Ala endopeptidase (penicillin-binding protein 7)
MIVYFFFISSIHIFPVYFFPGLWHNKIHIYLFNCRSSYDERIFCRMTAKSGFFLLVLLISGFSLDLSAGSIPTARPPKLRSAAVLVKDQRSGEFLVVKQANVAMPIASLTKLMTAMVILDAHLDMNTIITIEEADKDRLRNSHSHLLIGTQIARRDALRVALMASENRAAHALGRTFPGGVQDMVKAMNEKARVLGLNETRFEDPAGLSDGNVSSANDLGKIVEAACGYPLIGMFSTQPEATIRFGKRQLHFVNTNALVRNPRWQIGLSKTGYIEESGRCLVMQTNLAQRPVLMVLLNSTGKNTRLGDANRIRQWLESLTPRRESHR